MGVRVLVMVFVVALCGGAGPAAAQHFGRNKVRYDNSEFDVVKTAHFDIHVPHGALGAAGPVSRIAERWYARLSALLSHQLSSRQTLVLYASHSDFEQTNVVGGVIGETVGGVTEGMMRRIVLPFDAALGDTGHVIGHELVHAFQYDIAKKDRRSLAGVPLWFVEGMAEYLSVGPADSFTAMLLRDAVFHDNLPVIQHLARARMSPYRSGQAFWAWLAGEYGDSVLRKALSAPRRDVIRRLEGITGSSVAALNRRWHQSIREAIGRREMPAPEGRLLIGRGSGGRLNVAPVLSPDGSRLLFFSERDQLSMDVFVADAETGEVAAKLVTMAREPEVESLGMLRSSGSWSPDGSRIVLSLVKKGAAVLSLYDAAAGEHQMDIPLTGVDEVFQPAWGPDKRTIAFSGLVAGTSDLFTLDLESRRVTRLTSDAYTDLQPAWSPDGRQIAFVTDRFTTDLSTLDFGTSQIATLTLSDNTISAVQEPGESGTDPLWMADGRTLIYRSDFGGVPNVFARDLTTGQVSQLTNDAVGVTGLTPSSPAISASATGQLAFTVLRAGGFEIRTLDTDAVARPVADVTAEPTAVTKPTAGSLAAWLGDPRAGLLPVAPIVPARYESKLSLAAVGRPNFSMSTGGGRNSLRAGTSFLFSDVLGDRRVGIGIQAGRRLDDLVLQTRYVNRRARWTYGADFFLAPYIGISRQRLLDRVDGRQVLVDSVRRERQMHTVASGILMYPFHRTMRVEFMGGFHAATYRQTARTRTFDLDGGQLLADSDRSETTTLDPLRLFEASAALVSDTAVFGPVSALVGSRFRLQVTGAHGDLAYAQSLIDYRRYWMVPNSNITIAMRGLHVARYGGAADDPRLMPLSLRRDANVRGADYEEADEGSKLLAAQIELRFPLLGLLSRRLTWGGVPLEGFAFGDAGAAWRAFERPAWFGGSRTPTVSAGAGARVRLGGFVLEAAAAHRFERARRGWTLVLNARPPF